MGLRTLLLVRHGDYTPTIDTPDGPDGSLTDKGRSQTEWAAKRLQALNIDAIHSSSLLRASETAQIIAAHCAGVSLKTDDLLRECIPVVPAGLEKHFAGIPAEYIARGPAQAESVFATYFAPDAPDAPVRIDVIVSHGNLIGYLVARAMNAPAEAWLRADIGNCCISEVLVSPSGFTKLIRHNDGGHLPADLLA